MTVTSNIASYIIRYRRIVCSVATFSNIHIYKMHKINSEVK